MGRQLILSGADFSAANISLNWRPTLLGSSLAAWLKADAGVTSASGAVSQLSDQSTNAYALTQATSANQPTLSANVQNGLPGIASGTSAPQYLATTVAPSAVKFEHNAPFSVALAFKRVGISPFNGGDSWEAIINCLDPSNTYRGWFIGGSKPENETITFGLSSNGASGSESILVHGSTTLVAGKPYIAVVTYDGSGAAAGVKITLNGAAETLTVASDTLASNTTVGATQQLAILGAPGGIAGFQSIDEFLEGIVVNRVLTAQEITYANQYLDSRWAAY